MTIYTSTKVLPYVYRLDHPVTGEFYIGYRAVNKVPSSQDLGYKYFTSSKYVKPRFGEFTCTIVAEFFDHNDAYEFEQLTIFESWGQPGLLNKRHHRGDKAVFTNAGCIASDETRSKISAGAKARQPISDETRAKRSASMTGKIMSEESKEKNSEAHGIPVMIFGVIYKSTKDASKILGITYKIIRHRINSYKFPDWNRLVY